MTGGSPPVSHESEAAQQVELATIANELRPRLAQMHSELLFIASGLLRARRMLPHGSFSAWVEDELNISSRTAERMLNVARRFENKAATVSHLPPTVLYELAAPSTPQELVDDVLAGRLPPKVGAIREARRATKPSVQSPDRLAGRAIVALVALIDYEEAPERLTESLLRYDDAEDLAADLVTLLSETAILVERGSSDVPAMLPWFSGVSELIRLLGAARPKGEVR